MTETRTRALLGLLTLIVAALATPTVVIPALNRLHSTRHFPPTYLPALEGPRERARFEDSVSRISASSNLATSSSAIRWPALASTSDGWHAAPLSLCAARFARTRSFLLQ